MEDNLAKIEPTSFDKELLENSNLNTTFSVKDPTFYFSLIEEKLNIVGSMAVGGHLLCKISENQSDKIWPQFVAECLVEYLKDNNIAPNSELTIVGDNMLNYAYSMPISLLVKNVWDFFSIPQDTYVILCNTNLVFQYTYEDEFYVYNNEL